MSFSIRIGLERVEIAGPELELLLGRSVGSDVGLLCKNKKERGSAGARPLPLRCLSQFLPDERKDRLLRGRSFAYLSPKGWPGIYSICFSQLNGGKDSFPLDEVFSAFIAIRLLRDNKGTVIENYPSSLIGEIQFDLHDKLLLGIILLLLLVRFSLIYKTWAFQIVHAIGPWGEQTGLPFWAGARGPGVSLGLSFPWAWRVGLRAYF